MGDAAGPAADYTAAKAKQQALRGRQSGEVDEVKVGKGEMQRRRKVCERRTSLKMKHTSCVDEVQNRSEDRARRDEYLYLTSGMQKIQMRD